MLFPRAFTPVLAFVLFLGASWAPAQDRPYNAIPLAGASVATIGNNLGATNNIFDADPFVCHGSSDVWYSWGAACNGVVTVDTCGAATNFDTVLAVYDGTCGPNSLSLLKCNDDFCATRSKVTFDAAQGMTYYISVSGYAAMSGSPGAMGTFALTLFCVPGLPTNDDCSGATVLRVGDRIVGSNVGATTGSIGTNCGVAADVWYKIAPSVGGESLTISTCNADVGGVTNFDTTLNVYQDYSCSSLNPLSVVDCNDDACGGLQSKVTFFPIFGYSFWVSVGGYGGATGRFGLKVSGSNELAFKFFDQGPGTIGFRVSGGAPYYYLFATTHIGSGWLYGVNITSAELYYELGAGPPFSGPTTPCGTFGPFGPLPSGLTVTGVAIGASGAGGNLGPVSPSASFTIP